jgi:hypothetical protein
MLPKIFTFQRIARWPRIGPNVLPVSRIDIKREGTNFKIENLAQDQKVQRSEPNLPLNGAKLNMSEAEIFANSNAFLIGLPIISVRKIARVGQTHKKWNADSAPMEHAPQIGHSVSPMTLKLHSK